MKFILKHYLGEEMAEIEQKLSSDWGAGGGCMRIVTAYDGSAPGLWGSAAPAITTLARAQALARSTLSYIQNALMVAYEDNVLVIIFTITLIQNFSKIKEKN